MAVTKLLQTKTDASASAAGEPSPPDAVSASAHALSALLQAAASAGLSPVERDYLRCVLIARGAAKALGIREGLRRYVVAVDTVSGRLQVDAAVDATTATAEAAKRVEARAMAGSNVMVAGAGAVADMLRP
eukprot:4486416-Prymnesium_polylepis.1